MTLSLCLLVCLSRLFIRPLAFIQKSLLYEGKGEGEKEKVSFPFPFALFPTSARSLLGIPRYTTQRLTGEDVKQELVQESSDEDTVGSDRTTEPRDADTHSPPSRPLNLVGDRQ